MITAIALLRGINVGGHKKIKMTALKMMFQELGFSDIVTYIQSGNIIFKSIETDLKVVENQISKGILKTFGYDVSVLVITRETMVSIYKENPFYTRLENNEIDQKKMYFTILSSSPEQLRIAALQELSSNQEAFVITSKVVYFFAGKGYGNTKLNTSFFEKKLEVKATTRNLKTLIKLLGLSNLV